MYWITSHGRNSKGKVQESRHRFFATDLHPDAAKQLVQVGKPYAKLLDDMEGTPELARFNLADAARRAAEAPGGFNIEGLAATKTGGLLIGLRNPLFEGRALAIPLENPAEVIHGVHARFGVPFELDLGGRGIRSIELIDGTYYIVAGPTADEGRFGLFRWSGSRGDVPRPIESVEFGTLRPEALFGIPGTVQVQLLSDDGGLDIRGTECKDLAISKQTFRSVVLAR